MIRRAVYEGRPVVDRVLTVGGTVQKPANYLARIGSPVEWFLDTSGGLLPETRDVDLRRPHDGHDHQPGGYPRYQGLQRHSGAGQAQRIGRRGPLHSLRDAAWTPAPCMLSPTANRPVLCARTCYEDAEALGVMNCMECGACSWSCPSRRNLTQSCRVGKARSSHKRRQEAAAKKGSPVIHANESSSVSSSPFPARRLRVTPAGLMRDVVIALLPTALAAVWFFGAPGACALMLVSVIFAVRTRTGCMKKSPTRKSTIGDLSAVVTGLLLAFNLPARRPLVGGGRRLRRWPSCWSSRFFGGHGTEFHESRHWQPGRSSCCPGRR